MKEISMKRIVFGVALLALAAPLQAAVPVQESVSQGPSGELTPLQPLQQQAFWGIAGTWHSSLKYPGYTTLSTAGMTPDGRPVVAVASGNNIDVWDVWTLTKWFSKPSEYGFSRIDKHGHLYTNDSQSIKVWNLTGGSLQASFPRPAGVEVDLEVSDDGHYGLTGSSVPIGGPTPSQLKLFLFNTQTGQKILAIDNVSYPQWLGRSTNFVAKDSYGNNVIYNIDCQGHIGAI